MKRFNQRLKQSQRDREMVTVRYHVKGDSKHRHAKMRRCEVKKFLSKFKALDEYEVGDE
jgi:hypothetical protein